MDKDLVKTVVHLCGKDSKMLLLNNRYYCHFVGPKKELEPECSYMFFSGFWQDDNCPALVQYADVYVLDVDLEHGHHKSGYGQLYHRFHKDLDEDTFTLMLPDGASVMSTSLELLDVPYSLKEILRLAGFSYDFIAKTDEPIESLDGVSVVDIGRFGHRDLSIEYCICGKLYAEAVDFAGIPEGEVVSIDSPRREVIINMEKVTEDNAAELAARIRKAIDKAEQEHIHDTDN